MIEPDCSPAAEVVPPCKDRPGRGGLRVAAALLRPRNAPCASSLAGESRISVWAESPRSPDQRRPDQRCRPRHLSSLHVEPPCVLMAPVSLRQCRVRAQLVADVLELCQQPGRDRRGNRLSWLRGDRHRACGARMAVLSVVLHAMKCRPTGVIDGAESPE